MSLEMGMKQVDPGLYKKADSQLYKNMFCMAKLSMSYGFTKGGKCGRTYR